MAIYISKDAIKNIPLDSEGGDNGRKKLNSNILQSDPYFSKLVNNPNGTAPLKHGVKGESVRVIIFTFKIIEILYKENAPQFSYLNSSTTTFNDIVENNVKLFQSWVSLTVTGIVDAETVIAIDEKLYEHVKPSNFLSTDGYNVGSQKLVIGNDTNVEISYYDYYNEVTGEYSISTIPAYDGDGNLEFKISNLPRGTFVIVNDNSLPVNFITPSLSSHDILEKENSPTFSNPLSNVYNKEIPHTNIVMDSAEGKQYSTDIDSFLSDTPKSEFGDMAETYKVSPNESFSDIVLQKYYNTGPENIINPENGETIFSFPNRTPLQNREEDARFQFYLNFLYYSNTEEVNGNIDSWGMKMNESYSRYLVDQLEQFNIFNNNYNPADAQTALPNYYRFIKHMETVNPNSKLEFEDGQCLNFEAQAGKNIVIPKRQFVDSIYNLLNYRHGEMLEAVGNKMVQVQGAALSTIIGTLQSALNTLTGIAQEVKNDAIALYNEAADFFIKGLEFLIDFLKEYWPRGTGGRVRLDIEVTWGLPIATNVKSDRHIWRKVSKEDDVILCFSERGLIQAGGDVAVGVSAGLYSGVGKKKKTLGVNLGAGVENLYGIDFEATYEFPLRADETMLIAGLMAFLGPNSTSIGADILKFFNITNLEPRQYLTKGEIKLGNVFNLWGRASLGLESSGEGNVHIEKNAQSDAEMDANKSFGFIDNILQLLPGMGAIGELSVNSGIAFVTEFEYENIPKIPEIDARVFSKATTEVKFFTQASLSTGLMGNFFQKLFLGSITPIGPFFDSINFDGGIMLVHKVEMNRYGSASDVTLSDIKVTPSTQMIEHDVDGSIQYLNNQQSTVETRAYTYLGYFSGDIEELTAPGTEARLKLSLPELLKIYLQNFSYQFSFSNVKKLLLGFEYRKKVGLFKKESDFAKSRARKLKHSAHEKYSEKTVEIFRSADGTDTETTLLVTLFEKMSQPVKYIDTAVALGIKIEVPFNLMLSILEFYLKKLYHKYINIQFENQRIQFEKDLEADRCSIQEKVEKRLAFEENNSMKSFYDYLFAEENTYNSGSGTVTFKGLNGYIDQKLAEVPNPPQDFFDALSRFIKNPPSYDDFMAEIAPTSDYDIKDIGIHDFIDYFTVLTDITGLNITIEGLLGVSGGGSLKVGAGATVKIGLGGFLQLTYEGDLYKNGQLTDVGINNPLRDIFDQLDALLAKASYGKKVPVKTLFDIIKE